MVHALYNNCFGDPNSFIAIKKLSDILWNLQDFCHVHKGLLLNPLLRHMNPIYIFAPCSFKKHFNIILQCTPRSSKRFFTYKFSNQN